MQATLTLIDSDFGVRTLEYEYRNGVLLRTDTRVGSRYSDNPPDDIVCPECGEPYEHGVYGVCGYCSIEAMAEYREAEMIVEALCGEAYTEDCYIEIPID